MKIFSYICIVLVLFVSGCAKLQQSHSRVESQGVEEFLIINEEEPVNQNAQTYEAGKPTRATAQRKSSKNCITSKTQRSYVVLGKRYYPINPEVGDEFHGVASWYGPNFNGKKTSNGEIYDMYANTAASTTLPMHTMVKVYNKDNGRSVVVRINDRGPFVRGRIIDLSNNAARTINMHKKGVANVKVVVVSTPDICGKKTPSTQTSNKPYTRTPKPVIAPRPDSPTYKSGGYIVQIGSFLDYQSAVSLKNRVQDSNNDYKATVVPKDINGRVFNRVIFSGFGSKEEATRFKNNLYPGALVMQKR